jgi:hypothetical protein
MAVTIHTITRYTVQVLTRKVGEQAHSYITVRFYDEDNNNRGVAVFETYGDAEPPKPHGDYASQYVTAHLDVAHYAAYMDILRLERPVYLKIGWTQQGKARVVSQVSIDTKKEVFGEFFQKTGKSKRP